MLLSILIGTVTLLALSTTPARGIPTISAVGAKFFYSSGGQFFLKGVAYQFTDGADPLANTAQCLLDAAAMSAIGVNSIRIYHVDPNRDHDGCMAAFSAKGIYAWVDLDNSIKNGLVDQTHVDPTTPSLAQSQVDAYTRVLDAFAKYDNLAGAFVGNEIMTLATESDVAPYVKAAGVAVKKYRDDKKMRKIPIGYSAADIAGLRPMLQNYMACDPDRDNNLDFYSLNAYEWCGSSSYHTSGYDMLQANASGYSIPLFFSEVGCNTAPPRTFADQAAIFGPDMSDTWSGAIIYEWVMTENNYGIVSYKAVDPAEAATGTPLYGSPTPIVPDFSNLEAVWKTAVPSSIAMSDYEKHTSSITAPACPSSTPDGWVVKGNVALPTVGQSGVVTSSATAVHTSGGSTGATASASSTTSRSPASANVPAVESIGWILITALMSIVRYL